MTWRSVVQDIGRGIRPEIPPQWTRVKDSDQEAIPPNEQQVQVALVAGIAALALGCLR